MIRPEGLDPGVVSTGWQWTNTVSHHRDQRDPISRVSVKCPRDGNGDVTMVETPGIRFLVSGTNETTVEVVLRCGMSHLGREVKLGD